MLLLWLLPLDYRGCNILLNSNKMKSRTKPKVPKIEPQTALVIDDKIDGFDIATALKMRFINRMSYGQIGDALGTSKQNVHQRLQRFLKLIDEPQALEAFESFRGDILSSAELTLIELLVDPKNTAEANYGELVKGFKEIFTAGRLARNQSTANIRYTDLTRERTELRTLLDEYIKTHGSELQPEGATPNE
jgi:hypothetical protein